MPNLLSELKSALGAGARANKYRVNFSIPSVVGTKSDISQSGALCKSSSFPSKSIGQIEVWNQGRKLVLAGDTAYENAWDLTFYATEDHGLRKDILAWMKAIDDFQVNSHSGNPVAYMTEMSVEQLDSAGNTTATYTFHNIWPQNMSAIEVADETADRITEFTVTFTFSGWVSGTGETDDPASGNNATKNDVAE